MSFISQQKVKMLIVDRIPNTNCTFYASISPKYKFLSLDADKMIGSFG